VNLRITCVNNEVTWLFADENTWRQWRRPWDSLYSGTGLHKERRGLRKRGILVSRGTSRSEVDSEDCLICNR
jgi:hypothetical protein